MEQEDQFQWTTYNWTPLALRFQLREEMDKKVVRGQVEGLGFLIIIGKISHKQKIIRNCLFISMEDIFVQPISVADKMEVFLLLPVVQGSNLQITLIFVFPVCLEPIRWLMDILNAFPAVVFLKIPNILKTIPTLWIILNHVLMNARRVMKVIQPQSQVAWRLVNTLFIWWVAKILLYA